MMSAHSATHAVAGAAPSSVKQIALLACLLVTAVAAVAQPPGRPPVIGPNSDLPRRGLWQILTPDQREQVWRSLTPEQRTDVWRALEPQERREMRDRLAPGDEAPGMPWARRQFDPGNSPRAVMSPEERYKMREQIREAHRLRRERLEAERGRQAQ
jgi:hypothetical protein